MEHELPHRVLDKVADRLRKVVGGPRIRNTVLSSVNSA
jgi:hypothetical protein